MWIRGTDDLGDDEGSVSRLGGGRKAVPSSTWANIRVDSLFRTCVTVIAFSSVYGLEKNLPVHPPTAVEAPTNGVLSAVGGMWRWRWDGIGCWEFKRYTGAGVRSTLE